MDAAIVLRILSALACIVTCTLIHALPTHLANIGQHHIVNAIEVKLRHFLHAHACMCVQRRLIVAPDEQNAFASRLQIAQLREHALCDALAALLLRHANRSIDISIGTAGVCRQHGSHNRNVSTGMACRSHQKAGHALIATRHDQRHDKHHGRYPVAWHFGCESTAASDVNVLIVHDVAALRACMLREQGGATLSGKLAQAIEIENRDAAVIDFQQASLFQYLQRLIGTLA